MPRAPRRGAPRPDRGAATERGTMVSRHGCHSGLAADELGGSHWSAGLGRLPSPARAPLPSSSHGDQSLLRTLGWEPPSPQLAPRGDTVGGPLDPQPLSLLCALASTPLPYYGSPDKAHVEGSSGHRW